LRAQFSPAKPPPTMRICFALDDSIFLPYLYRTDFCGGTAKLLSLSHL
jgi:hypothetical protein